MKAFLSRNKRYIMISPKPNEIISNAIRVYYGSIMNVEQIIMCDIRPGKRKYELPDRPDMIKWEVHISSLR